MNQFKLNRKMKHIIGLVLLLLILVGCSNVIDPETGRVATEHIIALDTPWNFSEMGVFTAILIYPLAQVINFLSQYIGVTLAIVVLTLAIQLLTFRSTVKSTVTSQRMQLIQPEQAKIQEKYKGRDDQQSQMRMAQEIQALYKKYDIKMSAAFTPLLMSMPILIAVWQSVQRSAAVYNGELLGFSLAMTPKDGMTQFIPFYFIIFGLMALSQALSVLGPQWLNKRAQKKLPVYKQTDKPAQGQGMMYFMLVFMLFIGFTLPTAMCIYLTISSLLRFIQTAYIQHKYVNKEAS